MSLGVSRWAIHYSLAFHIIFSVLSIGMSLQLYIANGSELLWPTYSNFARAIIVPTLPLGLCTL
jgi:cytochrome bd-type quinol oxidase subunit 1